MKVDEDEEFKDVIKELVMVFMSCPSSTDHLSLKLKNKDEDEDEALVKELVMVFMRPQFN